MDAYAINLLQEILSHVKGSNMKVWAETDPHGNTAHHLAAETSNLAVLEVRYLKKEVIMQKY